MINTIKKCLNCEKEILYSKKFCNSSCSATFNNKQRSKETRNKQALSASKTIKNKIEKGLIKINNPKGNNLVPKIKQHCKKCNSEYYTIPSRKRKFCNRKCTGGYREGSGRSHSGYYKGIYCASTYELAWIIYNLDHNIKFSRFDGYLTDGSLKYYPDFIIDNNTIIEIKGYHTSLVDEKEKLAKSKGYNIKILYKNDLEEIFVYVSRKYNVSRNNFRSLYN